MTGRRNRMGSGAGTMHGWTGKRLWVDLTSGQARVESLEPQLLRDYLGGRGLNVRLLYDLVQADTDPLGPDNPLIFGTGPLTGTYIPSTGRYNVTAKSPATGILGDSNSSGFWAPELKYAGYDQIVIRGAAKHPVYLFVDDDRVEIRDASALWGRDTWETDAFVKRDVSDSSVQVAAIGPAGENMVKFAGIINNLGRAAGRTGMGAVMGSKRLKAVVLRGSTPLTPHDPEAVAALTGEMTRKLFESPAYPGRSRYGTALIVDIYGALGIMPTRNCQTGVFPGAERLGSRALYEQYVQKRKSCFACPVHCSRFYRVSSGPYAGTCGEGPEFETLCSLGSRCGNNDIASVLHFNTMANQLGLDTISAGNTIAFAMECFEKGLLSRQDTDGLDLGWGNLQSIEALLKKIALREGIGDLLAEGVYGASQQIAGSEKFALHVKKLEPPEQEVRGLKAWGLGWAVSSRGADHLRAYPVAETTWTAEQARDILGIEGGIDRFAYDGKAELVKWSEEICAVADSIEMCKITQMALGVSLDDLAGALRAMTGWDTDAAELQRIGERIVNLERLFDARQGITRLDDALPARFTEEPLPDGPSQGERIDLSRVLDQYYRLREWNPSTGLPEERKLKSLGLA